MPNTRCWHSVRQCPHEMTTATNVIGASGALECRQWLALCREPIPVLPARVPSATQISLLVKASRGVKVHTRRQQATGHRCRPGPVSCMLLNRAQRPSSYLVGDSFELNQRAHPQAASNWPLLQFESRFSTCCSNV